MSFIEAFRAFLSFILATAYIFSPQAVAGTPSQATLLPAYQTLATSPAEYIVIPLETPQVELSREYRVRHPMQDGSYVTSEYGMRCGVDGVYSGCLFHSGMDFGNGPSTGWLAYPTARGHVSFVGAFNGAYPGCGYYAAVYHPDYDITTVYCHLATPPYVQVGQYVTPDTAIGEVGTTGMSNGIHLHFMTARGSYYAGPHFNPREWFAQHGMTP